MKRREDQGTRTSHSDLRTRPTGGIRHWHVAAMSAALLAGLIGRLCLASIAPRWGYDSDHFENISMGLAARDRGLLDIYDTSPQNNPILVSQKYSPRDGAFEEGTLRMPRTPNYPPLGVTLFYLQASTMYAASPHLVANTFFSRLWMAVLPIAAELALAAGVLLLTRELAGPTAAVLAACTTWLLPPLAMDSALWGQSDSWFLAPAVWTVWLLIRGRWAWAGLAAALAVLLKPQGVLLAPPILLAALMLPAATGLLRPREVLLRLAKTAAAFVAALAVLTLPWMLTSGLTWVQRAFLDNLRLYPMTTLAAFNFWYLDALRLDCSPVFDALDSTATMAGLSKDAWGLAMLLAAMAALAAACWWRFRRRAKLGVVLFAGLWLWSAFLWPTRAHERYIVYAIPLVLVAAVPLKRLWPAVALLVLVATAELCHNVWLKPLPAGYFKADTARANYQAMLKGAAQMAASPPSFDDVKRMYWQHYNRQRQPLRPWELLATMASMSGYGWAVLAALAFASGPAPTAPPRTVPAKPLARPSRKG